MLFLVYINDLPTSIKCNVRLYADDVILYPTIHTLTNCISLQQDLNTLFHWATTWNMSFNPDKCKYIKITLKHNTISYNYTMSNAKIKEVSTAKYLGVTINKHLTWSNHIDNIYHKALSAKAFLQRNLTSYPPNIKLLCYITMVRSILEYASPVWSPYTKQDINRLEKVQHQSARFIMGDHLSYSSVSDMLKDSSCQAWNIADQMPASSSFIRLSITLSVYLLMILLH